MLGCVTLLLVTTFTKRPEIAQTQQNCEDQRTGRGFAMLSKQDDLVLFKHGVVVPLYRSQNEETSTFPVLVFQFRKRWASCSPHKSRQRKIAAFPKGAWKKDGLSSGIRCLTLKLDLLLHSKQCEGEREIWTISNQKTSVLVIFKRHGKSEWNHFGVREEAFTISKQYRTQFWMYIGFTSKERMTSWELFIFYLVIWLQVLIGGSWIINDLYYFHITAGNIDTVQKLDSY